MEDISAWSKIIVNQKYGDIFQKSQNYAHIIKLYDFRIL